MVTMVANETVWSAVCSTTAHTYLPLGYFQLREKRTSWALHGPEGLEGPGWAPQGCSRGTLVPVTAGGSGAAGQSSPSCLPRTLGEGNNERGQIFDFGFFLAADIKFYNGMRK